MQINEIPKSSNIELEIKFKNQTMTFRSTVVAATEKSVLISPITLNDQTVGFSDDCSICIIYNVEGKLYKWEHITIKLVKLDNRVFHLLDVPFATGKNYNRRNSFRLYLGEEMLLYINSAKGPSALNVMVKDISETGVGFISKEELDIDRTIRLKFKDDNVFISIAGTIVRKEFLAHLESYLYGCKFIEKSNLLGRYIAKKQAEILRKKNSQYSSYVYLKDPK